MSQAIAIRVKQEGVFHIIETTTTSLNLVSATILNERTGKRFTIMVAEEDLNPSTYQEFVARILDLRTQGWSGYPPNENKTQKEEIHQETKTSPP